MFGRPVNIIQIKVAYLQSISLTCYGLKNLSINTLDELARKPLVGNITT